MMIGLTTDHFVTPIKDPKAENTGSKRLIAMRSAAAPTATLTANLTYGRMPRIFAGVSSIGKTLFSAIVRQGCQ